MKSVIPKIGIDSSGGETDDVWKLELTTSVWSQIFPAGNPPAARHGHTAVLYGNNMVVFGGRGGNHLNDVWQLELVPGPNLRFPRKTLV